MNVYSLHMCCYFLLICLLTCHRMSLYLLMYLDECWLVMWLPLVEYVCFALARCYVVTLLHRDVCGVVNQ